MLNVQTEHLENHTARLTVEVDAERLETALRKASRRIAQKGRIPGFRPGKAPMNVVMNLYGREYVLAEALDKLGNEIYREALEAAEIDPYAPGSLEDTTEEEGLKLIFIVPKRPTIDLGDYRTIRLPYEVPDVTDTMVDDAMEDLRQHQAVVEPADRPIEMDDQVKFGHFEVVLLPGEEDAAEAEEEDAELKAEVEAEAEEADIDAEAEEAEEEPEDEEEVLLHRHDYEHILQSDAKRDLFPGFSEELVGLKVGDSKTFTLNIPEDYDNTVVAGRALRCEVEINEVSSRTVPEWTDALASTITSGEQETMLELRIEVRKQLEDQAKQAADSELADQALEKLVEGATIGYPEEIVQDYLDDIMQDLDRNLRQQSLTLKDYLTITGREEEEVRAEYRDRAVWRVERALALGELVQNEQLDVSEDDITAEVDRMAQVLGGDQAGQFKKFLMSDSSRMNISNQMATDRAIARIVAIAKGEEPPIGPDAASEDDTTPDTVEETLAEVATEDAETSAPDSDPEPTE